MKKLLFALLPIPFLFYSQILFAQETNWADEVLEYSSQLEETQYSVNQLLGKPNVFPWGDGSPSAWTPSRPGREEFIKVGFNNPKPIRQIAIAESYNPSALTKIFFYDEEGNEYLMIEREPVIVNQPGRFLRLFTELTEFNVAAVKLEFDGNAVPGYYSIDAIGITDSETPIDLQLELVPNVKQELVSERLDERVNSPYEELKPILSPDGKQLFFGRKFHPDNIGGIEDYEDIWVSDLDTTSNEWQEARNVGEPLNSDGPNWVSSITPDGNTMVLLIGNEYNEKRKKLYSGVSVSSKEGDSWSKPQNLQIEDFYNMAEKANFYLANSRKTLLMSIKREDSYGDRDLYISFEKRDGTWTVPMNLGETVNTATDETSPFLAADDKTLFFSSSGYIGFGKSDIYMTRRLDDTWQNWSEPYNMGPQVNSSGDDLFFSMPAEGNYAYYTKEDSVGDMNIFRLPMPLFNELDPVITITGRVVDAETQEPLDAIVSYETQDGEEVGKVETDPTTGEYQITLPAGKEYQYIAKVKGYLPISENVDLTNQKESKSFNNDMIMAPVKEKAEIVLNNVFFAFDSFELLANSKSELNRMVEVMKDNNQIEVVIIGHTDSTGPEEYNQMLSKKRAQSVVNYLTENGIAKERLDYLGKGESEPAYPNDTKENRSKNRRVNFKVEKE
ncbi:OmpA family protein [Marivirga sp.]|uniref:OmpA family protein n=1 Tax=Marivirga sp. TaxID=2018662 RepID=UPI002D80E91E|nr:OmpA family protein [Marivirga sp.]HET8858294.1 OmpA family protein [Marivirga sp.]